MSSTPETTAEEMQKLLEKIETIIPVAKEVEAFSNLQTTEGEKMIRTWVPNPEYPPHRKGECLAEDYGVWVFKEMPKLLSYIRTLEAEHRIMREAITDSIFGIFHYSSCEGDECCTCGVKKLRDVLSSLTLHP